MVTPIPLQKLVAMHSVMTVKLPRLRFLTLSTRLAPMPFWIARGCHDLKTQNKLPAPRLIVESVTQTTATIKIEGFYDKCRYYLSLTHTNCEEERVVIKELPPGSTQDCILYVYNEEGNADYKTEPVSFVLKPFILDVAVTETASSISAIGTHNADDVEITKREIAICSIEKGYGKDDNAFSLNLQQQTTRASMT